MIELFFDFISPYSYLAFSRAPELARRTGHEIELRPVLLAGILNALGTKGPAEVPARRAYLIKDVLRAAHRAGVPLQLPPAHPFNPLIALRVASLDVGPARRWQIADTLFSAAWRTGAGIDGVDAVSAALRSASIDPTELVARAGAPETKERLRRSTDEAVARGAFGVPTIFVGGEMFFGFDSFPSLEAFAAGADPLAAAADLIDRWTTLPASAVRR